MSWVRNVECSPSRYTRTVRRSTARQSPDIARQRSGVVEQGEDILAGESGTRRRMLNGVRPYIRPGARGNEEKELAQREVGLGAFVQRLVWMTASDIVRSSLTYRHGPARSPVWINLG